LASSYEDLIEWINYYKKIINKENNGAKIKFSKTAPTELSNLLQVTFLMMIRGQLLVVMMKKL
jgi:hypothetical protein